MFESCQQGLQELHSNIILTIYISDLEIPPKVAEDAPKHASGLCFDEADAVLMAALINLDAFRIAAICEYHHLWKKLSLQMYLLACQVLSRLYCS